MSFNFNSVVPDLKLDTDIAIVGASPRVMQGTWGANIDGHAEVIRINDGVFKGLEKHVGSKTTLRFIGRTIKAEAAPDGAEHSNIRKRHRAALSASNEAVLAHERNIDAIREMFPDRTAYEWTKFRSFVRNIHDRARGIPGVAYETIDAGRGFQPDGPFRSGLVLILGLLIASEFKAKLHVFGFDATGAIYSSDASKPYHYYETFKPALDNWQASHIDPAVEAAVLGQLMRAGYLTIY